MAHEILVAAPYTCIFYEKKIFPKDWYNGAINKRQSKPAEIQSTALHFSAIQNGYIE